MQQPILFALLFVVFRFTSGQANCPSACFQGTIEDAGPAVSDSFCPVAAGIINPVYLPNCLCYTPETFDGTPWLFCYTCGSTLSGNFADVCGGTTQVTQSCPNQDDAISQACKGDGDVNNVLGALCDDGKPSAIVTGISVVVDFFMPELAEGALSLVTEGCGEIKGAQTISSDVSQVCNVWPTAGCGTVDAASSSGSSASASTSAAKSPFFDRQKAAYMISLVLISIGGLLAY